MPRSSSDSSPASSVPTSRFSNASLVKVVEEDNSPRVVPDGMPLVDLTTLDGNPTFKSKQKVKDFEKIPKYFAVKVSCGKNEWLSLSLKKGETHQIRKVDSHGWFFAPTVLQNKECAAGSVFEMKILLKPKNTEGEFRSAWTKPLESLVIVKIDGNENTESVVQLRHQLVEKDNEINRLSEEHEQLLKKNIRIKKQVGKIIDGLNKLLEED